MKLKFHILSALAIIGSSVALNAITYLRWTDSDSGFLYEYGDYDFEYVSLPYDGDLDITSTHDDPSMDIDGYLYNPSNILIGTYTGGTDIAFDDIQVLANEYKLKVVNTGDDDGNYTIAYSLRYANSAPNPVTLSSSDYSVSKNETQFTVTVTFSSPSDPDTGDYIEDVFYWCNGYSPGNNSELSSTEDDDSFTFTRSSAGVVTGSNTIYVIVYDTHGELRQSSSITVNIVDPELTITTLPSASGTTYGNPLSASTLNGGVVENAQNQTVSGHFEWSTPTIIPEPGSYHKVTFYPDDSSTYDEVESDGNVNANISKAVPTVSPWPTASPITYGQNLSYSILDDSVCSTSVPGSFAWYNSSITPSVGISSQTVRFTPTDTTHYTTLDHSTSVTTNKDTPTVSPWPNASSITYGQSLSYSTLDDSGCATSVPGSFAWVNPSITPSAVGTSLQAVRFTPSDTQSYNSLDHNIPVITNPAKASLTSPPNHSTDQLVTVDLNWTNAGGATSYNVYYGYNSYSLSYFTSVTSSYCSTPVFDYGRTVYWRIDSVNGSYVTTGDVWDFSTLLQAPPWPPSNPVPGNGAQYVSTSQILAWTAGSGATEYRVFFGTDSTPDYNGEHKGLVSYPNYNPGQLSFNTTYYWEIYSKNLNPEEVSGGIWHFTTEPYDSLVDSWEMTYFGNLTQDNNGDPDNDGLTNLEESLGGASPVSADGDSDGLLDPVELLLGSNPLAPTPDNGTDYLLVF